MPEATAGAEPTGASASSDASPSPDEPEAAAPAAPQPDPAAAPRPSSADDQVLSGYELHRIENIQKNEQVLRDLGLLKNSPEKEQKPQRKPRVPTTQPQRAYSARLAHGTSVDYADSPEPARPKQRAARRPASSQKTPAPAAASGGEPSTVETVQERRGQKRTRPAPTAFSYHNVVIPPGVRAGSCFTCACGGQEVSVDVPLGFAPGMRLQFAVPCASDVGALTPPSAPAKPRPAQGTYHRHMSDEMSRLRSARPRPPSSSSSPLHLSPRRSPRAAPAAPVPPTSPVALFRPGAHRARLPTPPRRSAPACRSPTR